MNNLTDLEICKRIAEIEDVEFQIQNGKVLPLNPSEVIKDKLTDVYNPLTDKALCFDLMVKHNIELTPEFDGSYTAIFVESYTHDEFIDYHCCNNFGNDKNPQRAICLAIIAKEESKL